MCSYCFFQRDHSMRRYVSISTINSPEQTHECVCVALVCVCLHEVASPSIALIPPWVSSAKRQIIRGRPEASAEQLWMKLYPVQKKVERENDRKKRGKKATAGSKPQPGLSFMGKYFRKAWFHKRQTRRQRQHTKTRHFSNPQGCRPMHLVTSHAKMLIEPQMLLI